MKSVAAVEREPRVAAPRRAPRSSGGKEEPGHGARCCSVRGFTPSKSPRRSADGHTMYQKVADGIDAAWSDVRLELARGNQASGARQLAGPRAVVPHTRRVFDRGETDPRAADRRRPRSRMTHGSDDDHQGVRMPGMNQIRRAGAGSHRLFGGVRRVEHQVPREVDDVSRLGIDDVVMVRHHMNPRITAAVRLRQQPDERCRRRAGRTGQDGQFSGITRRLRGAGDSPRGRPLLHRSRSALG